MEDAKYMGPPSEGWVLFTESQSSGKGLKQCSGYRGIQEGWLHRLAKRSLGCQTTSTPAFWVTKCQSFSSFGENRPECFTSLVPPMPSVPPAFTRLLLKRTPQWLLN